MEDVRRDSSASDESDSSMSMESSVSEDHEDINEKITGESHHSGASSIGDDSVHSTGDDKDSDSDTGGFLDALELTPSAPQIRERTLTRTFSNDSSIPDESRSPTLSVEHRGSQSSITPPTTTNGSVQENGVGIGKSPTSQRPISTTSLDDVSLMDELPPSKPDSPSTDVAPSSSPPPSLVETIASRFSRSSTSSAVAATSANSNPLPRKMSSPFPPTSQAGLPLSQISKPSAPSPPPLAAQATPVPQKRSPFSWLRSSANASSTPPVTSSRRGTNSSVGSITGVGAVNNDLLIQRMEANLRGEKEKDEVQRGKQNLRENFKKLRQANEPIAGATGSSGDSTNNTIKGLEFASSAPGSPKSVATGDSVTKSDDFIDWDLWQAVVDDAFIVASEKPTELSRAIQAGIPTTLRGTVWQSMAGSKCLELEFIYRDVLTLPATATSEDARPLFGNYWLFDPPPTLSQSFSPKLESSLSPKLEPKVNGVGERQWGKTIAQLEKVIKRDLGERTSFGKYKVDQKALLNVCKAYALFDPAVGYTQGMTFIATVLLLNMSEEEAFCIFVKLMNKYRLRTMFQEKMRGLELRLYQYDRFLEDFEPRLAIHLKRQNIQSSLYAAQWFLTLFTYKFPLQLVLRVFDLLFSEGIEAPILQFGIVLMKRNAPKLLTMDFESLAPFLKEKIYDVYIDLTPSAFSVMEAGFFGNGGEKEVYRANELVCDAVGIKISPETLARYERDWEDIERLKRETEHEVEMLKRANASLQNKVKRLEEQNEDLNREYVRIASSEVGLKVENDSLADENEVLRAKVDGLRDMVDKQPQEIEDRYKIELEVLMQKNLVLHKENQILEENMMEMEKEFVSSKMRLATINEDYDLLKNRWNDLKKALGEEI